MPETLGPESTTAVTVQPIAGQLDPAPPYALQLARISLSASEGGVDAGVAMEIARGEHEMRRDLATGVLKIFVLGNSAVWTLVIMLVAVDVIMIASGH